MVSELERKLVKTKSRVRELQLYLIERCRGTCDWVEGRPTSHQPNCPAFDLGLVTGTGSRGVGDAAARDAALLAPGDWWMVIPNRHVGDDNDLRELIARALRQYLHGMISLGRLAELTGMNQEDWSLLQQLLDEVEAVRRSRKEQTP